MRTITLEFNEWCAWEAVKGVLVSDESVKQLSEFPTFDDAINWLYVNGNKDVARAFNAQLKEQRNGDVQPPAGYVIEEVVYDGDKWAFVDHRDVMSDAYETKGQAIAAAWKHSGERANQ